jgi:hypothetical protein
MYFVVELLRLLPATWTDSLRRRIYNPNIIAFHIKSYGNSAFGMQQVVLFPTRTYTFD